jgi:hypothetical protein
VSLSTAIQLGLAKYVFKLFIAALDTPFIYWARGWGHRGWFETGTPTEPGPDTSAPDRRSPYPQSVAQ